MKKAYLFDFVWSSDDFGMAKSEPLIYRAAMERIGMPMEQGVFFDDNVHALAAASRAGLYTVGVYDPSAQAFSRQLQKTGDSYILDFTRAEFY